MYGENEDGVSGFTRILAQNASNGNSAIYIGVDSTTTMSGTGGFGNSSASVNVVISAAYAGNPGIGLHYLQAEQLTTSSTNIATFYGALPSPTFDSYGMTGQLRM